MRVEGKIQAKSEKRASKEEASKMEEERHVSTMKAEIQAAAMDLAFQISDWL